MASNLKGQCTVILALAFLKIEPGHFPEGELMCRPPALGREQGHEKVWMGDSEM